MLALPQESTGQRGAPIFTDDLTAFRFDDTKLTPGRLYHYKHSNIDGSNASQVSLYLRNATTLEALKWNRGWTRATLVQAKIDWKTFSVERFQTFEITADGRQPRAELESKDGGRELVAGGGALRCTVEHLPWVSYDFDLASLNVALRFLTDPEGVATLGVADVVRSAGSMRLAFKGPIELRYLKDEERSGIPCRKYSIDGPGLEHRGGLLWAAADEEAYLVDFEIDLPDEPGFTSGKLSLVEKDQLEPEEWERFVKKSVRGQTAR